MNQLRTLNIPFAMYMYSPYEGYYAVIVGIILGSFFSIVFIGIYHSLSFIKRLLYHVIWKHFLRPRKNLRKR